MGPKPHRVRTLLVGGGVASVRCARALRRAGDDGAILIVGAEAAAPYNRPPLSKELLRGEVPDELVAAEPAGWYARRSVELWTDARVEALDLDRQTASLADGRRVAFDRCLLATGAAPRPLAVPGGERALTLRTIGDARRLRRAAQAAGRGASVIVVGGGFIGVEVASSLAALGLRPVILERAAHLWAGLLGTLLGEWAERRLADADVAVTRGETVERVEAEAVVTTAGRHLAALVIAGIGVVPRDELAREAGLEVRDGVLTDATHRTDHPAVWAAGDVARVAGRRVEHWHAAREGGEAAARAMLGGDLPPPQVPWVFSEVAGTPLDVVGVPEGWDDEAWVVPERVVAFVEGSAVVGLASIDGHMDPTTMRRLVAQGAGIGEVRAAAGG